LHPHPSRDVACHVCTAIDVARANYSIDRHTHIDVEMLKQVQHDKQLTYHYDRASAGIQSRTLSLRCESSCINM
jgi:hypothetical protein